MKMNKSISFSPVVGLVMLMVSYSCGEKRTNQLISRSQAENQEQRSLSKVEIDYEDMYTTTFVSVTCEGFEKAFPGLINKKKLIEPTRLSNFESFINQTLNDNKKTEGIDVRVKAKLFYSDNSSKEVCLGLHSLEYEGVKYSIPKDFTEYLLLITETEGNNLD